MAFPLITQINIRSINVRPPEIKSNPRTNIKIIGGLEMNCKTQTISHDKSIFY